MKFFINKEKFRHLKSLLLIVSFLFSQFPRANAQTPLHDASRELRRLFAPCVNPNPDVQFFYDLSAHVTDSVYFQRKVFTDTNDVNMWYKLYLEMNLMAYDTTWMLSDDSVSRLADVYLFKDTFPLAIIDYKYNILKPGVLDTNLWFDFDTVTNTVSDLPGRPSSPYEPVQNIFACSPLEEGYDYTNPVFMVNPSFIFTDPPPPGCNTCAKLQGTLKINFSDGTGWHNFSSDTTAYYRPNYPAAGNYLIYFALDSSGYTIKHSKALFRITSNTALITSDSTWFVPGMKIDIFGGCDGVGMQKKFVICLPGLDIMENTSAAEFYSDMIKTTQIEELRNMGYTFLVADWEYSFRDIRVNAMSVVGLIDTLKKRYPNLPPLVMIGHSMGGLVGRYALRWMETGNYLHDQTHPHLMKMHNTRLFISLDAPHRGANIPLAYQWLYRTVSYSPVIKMLLQPRIFHSITGMYAPRLQSIAVKQMLIYHINSNPNFLPLIDSWKYEAANAKGDLDADFMSLGNDGWPALCKKMALSNGSWMGDRQVRTWDKGYRYANDDFLKVSLSSYLKIRGKKLLGTEMLLAMRSNPDGDGDVFECNMSIYSFAIKVKKWRVDIGFFKTVLAGTRKTALDCRPFCVSAGSNSGLDDNLIAKGDGATKMRNRNILDMFELSRTTGGGGVKLEFKIGHSAKFIGLDMAYEARSDGADFGFIPTGSSFAYTEFESGSLDDVLLNYPVADLMAKTPFDVVVTNPSHHVEYASARRNIGNRHHLGLDNEVYDMFHNCIYPNNVEVNSRIYNREIGDDTLYLENLYGMIPFDIEAYHGVFVNTKNPHYNYPDTADIAKFSDYQYRTSGRDTGYIILSKDNPYQIVGAHHTFRSNDTFAQTGLNTWDYTYIPSGISPCCISYSLPLRRSNNPVDSNAFIAKQFGYVKLYPNPASDGQNIRVDYRFAKGGQSHIVMYNLMGQKLFDLIQQDCNVNDKVCTFEMTTRPYQSGIYMLKISNGEETFNEKVIINH